MVNKMKIHEVIIVLTIVLGSIIGGIIILMDSNRPDYYRWLPILPISFGIINLFAYRIFAGITRNLPYGIVIVGYMVRNVITPVVMRYGEYAGVMKILSNTNANRAIALMIYETIIVFGLLLVYKRQRNEDFSRGQVAFYLKKRPIKLFYPIIGCIAVICLFCYIKVPGIALNKTSILQSSEVGEVMGGAKLYDSGTSQRIFYTLFQFLFNFFRIFMGVILIVKIRKVVGDNWGGIIGSILVITSNLLFITNETGYIFIIVFVLFIITYQLFRRMRKRILVVFSIGFIFTVSSMYMVKSQILSGSEETSSVSRSIMLQAYFPGVCNNVGIFNIEDENKLSILCGDLYSMIPFKNTILPLEDVKGIIDVYSYYNRQYYQIVPCVAQGYYYMGFIFAPILSGGIILCGIKAYRKLFKTDNIWEASSYLLLSIFSCVTPIMYNGTIWGTRLLGTIIPMLIISRYLKLRRFNTMGNTSDENRLIGNY